MDGSTAGVPRDADGAAPGAVDLVGVLASAVRHELSNPLMVVGLHLEVAIGGIASGSSDPIELTEGLGGALDAVARIRRVLDDFTVFGTSGESGPSTFDAARVVDSVVRLIAPELSGRILVSCRVDRDAVVTGEAALLAHAVMSMLFHVAEHVAPAERERPNAAVALRRTHGAVRVTVEAAVGELTGVSPLPHTTSGASTSRWFGQCVSSVKRLGGTVVREETAHTVSVRISLPVAEAYDD